MMLGKIIADNKVCESATPCYFFASIVVANQFWTPSVSKKLLLLKQFSSFCWLQPCCVLVVVTYKPKEALTLPRYALLERIYCLHFHWQKWCGRIFFFTSIWPYKVAIDIVVHASFGTFCPLSLLGCVALTPNPPLGTSRPMGTSELQVCPLIRIGM